MLRRKTGHIDRHSSLTLNQDDGKLSQSVHEHIGKRDDDDAPNFGDGDDFNYEQPAANSDRIGIVVE